MTDLEFALVCLAIGLCQLWCVFLFFRHLRREFASEPPAFAPPVCVLVPCKEAPEGFRDCVESLMAQEYGGKAEFIFIVSGERDPAYAALGRILAGKGKNCRIVVSNASPERCSAKIQSLLYGIEKAPAQAQALVFADSDIVVTPDWLRSLVAPLGDSKVTISTSSFLFVPRETGLWSLLGAVWMGVGLVYFRMTGCVMGASCAVRKEDFAGLGIAAVWGASLSEDLALTAVAGKNGKTVRFVGRALSVCRGDFDMRGFLGQFGKWMLLYRVYYPRVWLLGALLTFIKGYVLYWSLLPPANPGIPALLFGMDAVQIYLVFLIYLRFVPDRFYRFSSPRKLPLRAAMTAPLLWGAYVLNFLHSVTTRDYSWAGTVYRLRGPQDIEVLR